jgi:hypothetical protein
MKDFLYLRGTGGTEAKADEQTTQLGYAPSHQHSY